MAASNLLVKAHLIVVHAEDGVQHYLHRGAVLPDWVHKDHVKQLKDADLVEAPKKAPAKPAKKSADSKPADDDAGSGDQDGDDGEQK